MTTPGSRRTHWRRALAGDIGILDPASGRSWGMIIEDVSENGRAVGFTLFGPPMPTSVQSPALHVPIVGYITSGKLVVKGKKTEIVAELRPQNRIGMTETYTNGATGSALLKPVWQLIEAERLVRQ